MSRALLLELLRHRSLGPDDVDDAVISCVVPSVLYTIEKACRRYLHQEPLIVGRGIKTGMRVRTDNPEVGADRIVNSVAAFRRHEEPLVVVDFGTATTFDCVDENGDYVGGAPGFRISADALFERTASFPVWRSSVRGRPSAPTPSPACSPVCSGAMSGWSMSCPAMRGGTVDGPRSGRTVMCVATGGLANLVGRACEQTMTSTMT